MAMNCTSLAGQDSLLNNSASNSIQVKEDPIKTQFDTREGCYKLLNSGEHYPPNRVGYTTPPQTNIPVKCSFISLSDSCNNEKICYNVGRELYVYNFKANQKPTDLIKPVDKRVYKGTYPTCHDFNQVHFSSDCAYLLVGFSAGQIQLIDPIRKEISKLYNEERLIDKTKVTCIKWVPGSLNLFLVSHSSGQLYVYKEDLPCGTTPPHYQIFKQGEGFSIYTCRTKSTRNPLYRWVIGDGSINEFAFSPCSKYLATVSQDGFLRVFNYDTMELVGRVRSYFGGLLCVCWSPDSKFVIVGGEDDLVSVWSLLEKRVIARGQGHKSWVSVVSFDPYLTCFNNSFANITESEEDLTPAMKAHRINDSLSLGHHSNSETNNEMATFYRSNNKVASSTSSITSYRFGSVGQDTQLCLWDLSEDVIKQPAGRTRTSILLQNPSSLLPLLGNCSNSSSRTHTFQVNSVSNNCSFAENNTTTNHTVNNNKSTETIKDHKKNFSLGSRNSDKNSLNKASHSKLSDDPVRLLGTPVCPRLDEVPLLEPLVCKKIAHERLTSLVFKEDCFVTTCQEGSVYTWARPGKWINKKSSPCQSIGTDINDIDESGSTVV